MAEERKVKFEGLSQWRSGFCLELAGRSFQLIMDNGHDYLLNFVSGEAVIWSERGKAARWDRYQCLKGDETTYFVNAEIPGLELRTGVTLILDTEQSLVTMLIAHQGENLKYPNLVTNELVFGAIKVDGEELPRKRHGFTTDLIGKQIAWTYMAKMTVTHVYYHPNYYRTGKPSPERLATMSQEMIERRKKFPTDEPSIYVKIKENLYFFSFIETTGYMTGRGKGNNMSLLIDTARLHDVGRSFGMGMTGEPENYLFAAIGKWVEDDGTATEPTIYRV